MTQKLAPYLTLDQAVTRLRGLRDLEGGALAVVLEGPRIAGNAVLCQFVLGKASAANVFEGVSRKGRPVVLAVSAVKPAPLLDLDATITQLLALKEQAGSGEVPVLGQFAKPTDFQLCDFWFSKASANDVFRSVSRGGQSVIRVASSAPW
jgi:hypothetical protein